MVVLRKSYKFVMQEGMKKIIFQGLIIIILFLSSWFLLNQIDWMTLLKVEQKKSGIEDKLGEMFLDIFRNEDKENNDEIILNAVDSIILKVCFENKIEKSRIKVHVLKNDDINAFALPGGHLIIYSGLIIASESPEELSGVICHEIAHIELDHVMKKLIKEMGLNVLLSMTSNGSTDISREAAKLLSSSAFDRNMETEADKMAIDLMIEARIDPSPFADFMYKNSKTDDELLKRLSWINTHPGSEERVTTILRHIEGRTFVKESVLSAETWKKLTERLKD